MEEKEEWRQEGMALKIKEKWGECELKGKMNLRWLVVSEATNPV
jgi:hypothetical protein